MTATSALTEFTWQPQPEAAAFIAELVEQFQRDCPWLTRLAARMQTETGTRLVDWIDHFQLPAGPEIQSRLIAVGYTDRGGQEWRIDSGLFPPVRLDGKFFVMMLKVDSVRDFLLAHGAVGDLNIQGDPTASLRWDYCPQRAAGLHVVCAIERHGDPSLSLKSGTVDAGKLLHHEERLLLRRRQFDDDLVGFEHTKMLIKWAAVDLGMPRACDLFFRAERSYWQSRNRAAQIQKMRQDALGLGWANHDHHTYRSSREYFATLIRILEMMGFHCRERFYAGKEAGWGAQVLEDPMTGVVIFADVDLSPEEVAQDFSHTPLFPRDKLGTVGLWCKLHGEAFLEAGMHHLECQFDFNAAREGLKEVGVDSMKPFTDFTYLRQAFTKGEVWPVAAERIAALLEQNLITPQQAETFRTKGAVGSHLEILERNDGYKGFNQTGINEIIRDTDPRRLSEALGSDLSAPAH
ncbi:hypothetical protein Pan44_21780 [Caulifigura coniformis]|uniref:Uncharacterized protein n=1 Tax=Caulifigura coniformis TaxID=2527983 RepID=A0A517SDG3_9PLAN|nr:hypothetical protein [Caulifigura coniformis]QDT54151.1 hypothetical protein Pan44_21780 [Caulifigura coniformis]